MGSFSIWHWLIVFVWIAAVGWPVAKILRRMGFSGWWTILAFVPLVNVAGLWILALADWPRSDASGRDAG